jgi:hypothetical protein
MKKDSPKQGQAAEGAGAVPDMDTGAGYSLCDDFCPFGYEEGESL